MYLALFGDRYTHDPHAIKLCRFFCAFIFLASHATIIAFLRRSWPGAKNDGFFFIFFSFFHCHTALIGRFRIDI